MRPSPRLKNHGSSSAQMKNRGIGDTTQLYARLASKKSSNAGRPQPHRLASHKSSRRRPGAAPVKISTQQYSEYSVDQSSETEEEEEEDDEDAQRAIREKLQGILVHETRKGKNNPNSPAGPSNEHALRSKLLMEEELLRLQVENDRLQKERNILLQENADLDNDQEELLRKSQMEISRLEEEFKAQLEGTRMELENTEMELDTLKREVGNEHADASLSQGPFTVDSDTLVRIPKNVNPFVALNKTNTYSQAFISQIRDKFTMSHAELLALRRKQIEDVYRIPRASAGKTLKELKDTLEQRKKEEEEERQAEIAKATDKEAMRAQGETKLSAPIDILVNQGGVDMPVEVRRNSAAGFAHFSQDKVGQDQICKYRDGAAIDTIYKLLESKDKETQHHASIAVGNMAVTPKIRGKLMQGGNLRRLLKVALDDNTGYDTRTGCAFALANLTASIKVHSAFMASIQDMLALIESPHKHIQRHATQAVQNFCLNELTWSTLMECNITEVLLNILAVPNHHPDTYIHCVAAINSLMNMEGVPVMVCMKGFVPTIVDIAHRSTSEPLLMCEISGFFSMLAKEAQTHEFVVEVDGFFGAMGQALTVEAVDVRFNCSSALSLFAEDIETHESIRSQQVFPRILDICTIDDVATRVECAQFLVHMSGNTAMHTELVDSGLLTTILQLLVDEDDTVRTLAAVVCATLAQNEFLLPQLVQSDLIRILYDCSFGASEPDKVSRFSLIALANTASLEQAQEYHKEELLRLESSTLSNKCSSTDGYVRETIALFLSNLCSKHVGNHQILHDRGLFEAVSTFLDPNMPQTEKCTINTLSFLGSITKSEFTHGLIADVCLTNVFRLMGAMEGDEDEMKLCALIVDTVSQSKEAKQIIVEKHSAMFLQTIREMCRSPHFIMHRKASRILSQILEDEECQSIISGSGLRDTVHVLLQSPDEEAVSESLHTFASLTMNPNLIDSLEKLGVDTFLTSGMTLPYTKSRYWSFYALGNYCSHPKISQLGKVNATYLFKRYIALSSAVRADPEERTSVAYALANYTSHKETKKQIQEVGLTLLKSSFEFFENKQSNPTQVNVALVIRNLCSQLARTPVFREAYLIKGLRKMIGSATSHLSKYYIMCALQSLAADYIEFGPLFVQAAVPSQLVSMTSTSISQDDRLLGHDPVMDPRILRVVLTIMFNLSYDETACEELMQSGLCDCAVGLLESPDTVVRQIVSLTLSNVSVVRSLRTNLVCEDGLRVLMDTTQLDEAIQRASRRSSLYMLDLSQARASASNSRGSHTSALSLSNHMKNHKIDGNTWMQEQTREIAVPDSELPEGMSIFSAAWALVQVMDTVESREKAVEQFGFETVEQYLIGMMSSTNEAISNEMRSSAVSAASWSYATILSSKLQEGRNPSEQLLRKLAQTTMDGSFRLDVRLNALGCIVTMSYYHRLHSTLEAVCHTVFTHLHDLASLKDDSMIRLVSALYLNLASNREMHSYIANNMNLACIHQHMLSSPIAKIRSVGLDVLKLLGESRENSMMIIRDTAFFDLLCIVATNNNSTGHNTLVQIAHVIHHISQHTCSEMVPILKKSSLLSTLTGLVFLRNEQINLIAVKALVNLTSNDELLVMYLENLRGPATLWVLFGGSFDIASNALRIVARIAMKVEIASQFLARQDVATMIMELGKVYMMIERANAVRVRSDEEDRMNEEHGEEEEEEDEAEREMKYRLVDIPPSFGPHLLSSTSSAVNVERLLKSQEFNKDWMVQMSAVIRVLVCIPEIFEHIIAHGAVPLVNSLLYATDSSVLHLAMTALHRVALDENIGIVICVENAEQVINSICLTLRHACENNDLQLLLNAFKALCVLAKNTLFCGFMADSNATRYIIHSIKAAHEMNVNAELLAAEKEAEHAATTRTSDVSSGVRTASINGSIALRIDTVNEPDEKEVMSKHSKTGRKTHRRNVSHISIGGGSRYGGGNNGDNSITSSAAAATSAHIAMYTDMRLVSAELLTRVAMHDNLARQMCKESRVDALIMLAGITGNVSESFPVMEPNRTSGSVGSDTDRDQSETSGATAGDKSPTTRIHNQISGLISRLSLLSHKGAYLDVAQSKCLSLVVQFLSSPNPVICSNAVLSLTGNSVSGVAQLFLIREDAVRLISMLASSPLQRVRSNVVMSLLRLTENTANLRYLQRQYNLGNGTSISGQSLLFYAIARSKSDPILLGHCLTALLRLWEYHHHCERENAEGDGGSKSFNWSATPEDTVARLGVAEVHLLNEILLSTRNQIDQATQYGYPRVRNVQKQSILLKYQADFQTLFKAEEKQDSDVEESSDDEESDEEEAGDHHESTHQAFLAVLRDSKRQSIMNGRWSRIKARLKSTMKAIVAMKENHVRTVAILCCLSGVHQYQNVIMDTDTVAHMLSIVKQHIHDPTSMINHCENDKVWIDNLIHEMELNSVVRDSDGRTHVDLIREGVAVLAKEFSWKLVQVNPETEEPYAVEFAVKVICNLSMNSAYHQAITDTDVYSILIDFACVTAVRRDKRKAEKALEIHGEETVTHADEVACQAIGSLAGYLEELDGEIEENEMIPDKPVYVDLDLVVRLLKACAVLSDRSVRHLSLAICKFTSRTLVRFPPSNEDREDVYNYFLTSVKRLIRSRDIEIQHFGFLTLVNFIMKVDEIENVKVIAKKDILISLLCVLSCSDYAVVNLSLQAIERLMTVKEHRSALVAAKDRGLGEFINLAFLNDDTVIATVMNILLNIIKETPRGELIQISDILSPAITHLTFSTNFDIQQMAAVALFLMLDAQGNVGLFVAQTAEYGIRAVCALFLSSKKFIRESAMKILHDLVNDEKHVEQIILQGGLTKLCEVLLENPSVASLGITPDTRMYFLASETLCKMCSYHNHHEGLIAHQVMECLTSMLKLQQLDIKTMASQALLHIIPFWTVSAIDGNKTDGEAVIFTLCMMLEDEQLDGEVARVSLVSLIRLTCNYEARNTIVERGVVETLVSRWHLVEPLLRTRILQLCASLCAHDRIRRLLSSGTALRQLVEYASHKEKQYVLYAVQVMALLALPPQLPEYLSRRKGARSISEESKNSEEMKVNHTSSGSRKPSLKTVDRPPPAASPMDIRFALAQAGALSVFALHRDSKDLELYGWAVSGVLAVLRNHNISFETESSMYKWLLRIVSFDSKLANRREAEEIIIRLSSQQQEREHMSKTVHWATSTIKPGSPTSSLH